MTPKIFPCFIELSVENELGSEIVLLQNFVQNKKHLFRVLERIKKMYDPKGFYQIYLVVQSKANKIKLEEDE